MANRYYINTNRWKFATDDLLLKIIKAIKGGMTDSWEYKERFGSRTPIQKLIDLGYVKYTKKDGYRITEEGESFYNANIKVKSNM